MSDFLMINDKYTLQSCCVPAQHGAASSRRLTVTASTRSSAAANAPATASHTFHLLTDWWRILMTSSLINYAMTLDIHSTISFHHLIWHKTLQSPSHNLTIDNPNPNPNANPSPNPDTTSADPLSTRAPRTATNC